MDVRTCSPPKHEKAYRDQPAARHERNETFLRLTLTIAVEILRLGREEPHDEDAGGNYGTAKKPEERQSYFSLVEAVDFTEDYWEGLQPSEEQDTDQRRICVEEETHWLLEAENPWSDNCLMQDTASSDIQGSELSCRSERAIPSALAQALGSTIEDV